MKTINITILMAILVTGAALATTVDIKSDSNTQFKNGSNWVNSVDPIWNHPSWAVITAQIPGDWIYTAYEVSPGVNGEAYNGATNDFQRAFEIPECATNIKGTIDVTADNQFDAKLNGNEVVSGNDWGTKYSQSFTPQIGPNTFDFNVINWGKDQGYFLTDPEQNPGGLIYDAKISYDGCGREVPEFGTVAALIALAGAVAAFLIIRK